MTPVRGWLLATNQDGVGRACGYSINVSTGADLLHCTGPLAASLGTEALVSLLAVRSLLRRMDHLTGFDVDIDFDVDWTFGAGPSCRLSFANSLLESLGLVDQHPDRACTGIVLPDGSVGPVDGIDAKLRVAELVGATRLVVHESQKDRYLGDGEVFGIRHLADLVS